MPDITIPEEAACTILLAMNPVIEYPGSSMIQRARRLRYHVETRGWEQTEKQFPEVARMRAELTTGMGAAAPLTVAAELKRWISKLAPATVLGERSDSDEALVAGAIGELIRMLEARVAELRGVGSHEAPEPENQT